MRKMLCFLGKTLDLITNETFPKCNNQTTLTEFLFQMKKSNNARATRTTVRVSLTPSSFAPPRRLV